MMGIDTHEVAAGQGDRAPERLTETVRRQNDLFRGIELLQSQFDEVLEMVKERDLEIRDLRASRERSHPSGFSERVKAVLGRAVRESGEDAEDVLLKGLALFLKASEAERSGQRLAILDEDDVIVRELTGINAPLPEFGSLAAVSGETQP